jgi:type VI secretion system secreted protein Hcp
MRKPRVFVLAALLSAATALVPLGDAHAALNAYLKLKGEKQGDIKGSVTQKGREGGIKVIAVSHEIVSPRDAASGLPTGKRMHKPIVLTLELDRSTPLLFAAMTKGEKFSTLSLDVGGPNGGASLYRVALTGASISAIEFVTLADKDTTAVKVSLTYQKIEWTWVDGGITAMDDWESPVAAKKL